jgi:hypothetical protein
MIQDAIRKGKRLLPKNSGTKLMYSLWYDLVLETMERKWLWPIPRHCPETCTEGMMTILKTTQDSQCSARGSNWIPLQ